MWYWRYLIVILVVHWINKLWTWRRCSWILTMSNLIYLIWNHCLKLRIDRCLNVLYFFFIFLCIFVNCLYNLWEGFCKCFLLLIINFLSLFNKLLLLFLSLNVFILQFTCLTRINFLKLELKWFLHLLVSSCSLLTEWCVDWLFCIFWADQRGHASTFA